ncbi:hypothetical protein E2P81_ATG06593 [Venturia nashicola]|nr:hypothetical protein E2P81_ATG06593 [Venturia nashicola]
MEMNENEVALETDILAKSYSSDIVAKSSSSDNSPEFKAPSRQNGKNHRKCQYKKLARRQLVDAYAHQLYFKRSHLLATLALRTPRTTATRPGALVAPHPVPKAQGSMVSPARSGSSKGRYENCFHVP